MATRTSAEPYTEVRTITTTEAKEMLSKNIVNRTPRRAKIDQYVSDMTEKRWNFSPDPITFDSKGKLINGQHRLTAQIEAGLDMTWVVCYNAPNNTQNTMDAGVGRSAADTLHLAGEENAQLLAAITRLVREYERTGLKGKMHSISPQEILQTVKANPSLRRATEMAEYSKGKMTPIPPSIFGAAWWLIRQENSASEADQFVYRVATLTGEEEGSPILALSRSANAIKRGQKRVHKRDLLALMIKAWNYHAENRTSAHLALYTRSGSYETPVALKANRAFDSNESN